ERRRDARNPGRVRGALPLDLREPAVGVLHLQHFEGGLLDELVQRGEPPVGGGPAADGPRPRHRLRALSRMGRHREAGQHDLDLAARQLVGDREAEHGLVHPLGRLTAGEEEFADAEDQVDDPRVDDLAGLLLGRFRRRDVHEDVPGAPEPLQHGGLPQTLRRMRPEHALSSAHSPAVSFPPAEPILFGRLPAARARKIPRTVIHRTRFWRDDSPAAGTKGRMSTPDGLRDAAERCLRALAGDHARLRDDQWTAIRALVVERRRALVVQRTGWGKSAVYFVATRLLRERGAGPTVIISPLLALMRNQIEAARRAGIHARTINSSNTGDWDQIFAEVDAGDVDVLLVSPERLNNPDFRDLVLPKLAAGAGLVVVDEAH